MVLFYLASAPALDADGELLEGGVSVSERKQIKEEKGAASGPATQQAKEAEKVAEHAVEQGEELAGSQESQPHSQQPTGPHPPKPDPAELSTGKKIRGLAVGPIQMKGATAVVPDVPADSGLTLATLRSRRDGKKVKGAYLTPDEMQSLAATWQPYRSIASFFMYTLVDGASK